MWVYHFSVLISHAREVYVILSLFYILHYRDHEDRSNHCFSSICPFRTCLVCISQINHLIYLSFPVLTILHNLYLFLSCLLKINKRAKMNTSFLRRQYWIVGHNLQISSEETPKFFDIKELKCFLKFTDYVQQFNIVFVEMKCSFLHAY